MARRRAYQLLAWLVDNAPVSVATWQDRAGLDVLTGAPFNLCVRLQDGQVVLDHDRLANLAAADAYSWHYAIVEAVRRAHDRRRGARRGDIRAETSEG